MMMVLMMLMLMLMWMTIYDFLLMTILSFRLPIFDPNDYKIMSVKFRGVDRNCDLSLRG